MGGLSPWKWALLPAMLAVILMSYLWAQSLPGFQSPPTARIIFWHVPMAILSMVWFWIAGFYAARYLLRGVEFDDTRSAKAAEVGLVLTVLATVTGAIFSKMQWAGGFNTPWYVGYWQWDPQQTAIVIVILYFAAYFGLRMTVEDARKRARLSAVYAMFGAVGVPVCYFILPRLQDILGISNHPTGQVIRGGMDTPYRTTFWLSTLTFMGVSLWAYQLQLGLERLKERRLGSGDEGGRTVAVRAPVSPEQPAREPVGTGSSER
jgi:heme exporter protein C